MEFGSERASLFYEKVFEQGYALGPIVLETGLREIVHIEMV